jgi:hypothetical protein
LITAKLCLSISNSIMSSVSSVRSIIFKEDTARSLRDYCSVKSSKLLFCAIILIASNNDEFIP